ncbi:MFS family permease [Catenuloplanes nepalensis]|uniref:MFS family permease n=1 Tax=Catenuloplanes nepalensis TaxID=587533 RepID=A0ABT9N1Q1_9ACTN|nr:MFS transporter [Catenuloplanes nepalensis]MDP9797614.1 MFS family permease [Catenuloplanes nepalensis]
MIDSVFDRRHLLTTVGAVSLVLLAAFESLAVTTVMPIITEDLGGRDLYTLGFAATLAAGAVGMVAGGTLADRRGPARPLLAAIGVFAAGLALAGLAATMAVFIAGRLLQGLGYGAYAVALNVLVARVYPPALHPRLFGLFAAAWVVPSLIGPFAAGLVTDALSWHWVFLGVLILVALVTPLIVPALRRVTPVVPAPLSTTDLRRIAAAVVVATAVVTLSLTSSWLLPPTPADPAVAETAVAETAPARPVLAETAPTGSTSAETAPGGSTSAGAVSALGAVMLVAVVLAVAALALRPLLPAGTLRAARGLPSTILVCGAAGAAFFGTEAYLPLLLQDRYGYPAWLSGAVLTAAALSWALASDLQGRRFAAAVPHRTVIRLGAALLALGVLTVLATAALRLHPLVAGAGWLLAGGGMGAMYPRISTAVLAFSAPDTQGFNLSAKAIADAAAGSITLSVTGLIFHSLGTSGFTGALALTTAAGLATLLIANRITTGHPPLPAPPPTAGRAEISL